MPSELRRCGSLRATSVTTSSDPSRLTCQGTERHADLHASNLRDPAEHLVARMPSPTVADTAQQGPLRPSWCYGTPGPCPATRRARHQGQHTAATSRERIQRLRQRPGTDRPAHQPRPVSRDRRAPDRGTQDLRRRYHAHPHQAAAMAAPARHRPRTGRASRWNSRRCPGDSRDEDLVACMPPSHLMGTQPCDLPLEPDRTPRRHAGPPRPRRERSHLRATRPTVKPT